MKNRITLGTAKLGNPDYGFSNQNNKDFDSLYFLNQVYKKGICFFDTSPRYGESEKILGNFIKSEKIKNIKISSKVDSLKPGGIGNEKLIYDSVQNSLKNLSIDKLDICYLHQNDIEIISDKKILQIMTSLKSEGLVEKIGTSIYTKNEFDFSLDCSDFDVIQAPINILNLSYYNLFLKSNSSKKLVARSLFLQGIITHLSLGKKLNYFYEIQEKIFKIRKILEKYKTNLSELCVSAITSLDCVHSSIIGSTSLGNMVSNINSSNKSIDKKIINELIINFSELDNCTNPKKWIIRND